MQSFSMVPPAMLIYSHGASTLEQFQVGPEAREVSHLHMYIMSMIGLYAHVYICSMLVTYVVFIDISTYVYRPLHIALAAQATNAAQSPWRTPSTQPMQVLCRL